MTSQGIQAERACKRLCLRIFRKACACRTPASKGPTDSTTGLNTPVDVFCWVVEAGKTFTLAIQVKIKKAILKNSERAELIRCAAKFNWIPAFSNGRFIQIVGKSKNLDVWINNEKDFQNWIIAHYSGR